MAKTKPKPAIDGTNRGRPPKEYKPEYCQLLIDHMAKGFSFESFGAEISTSRTVLFEWLNIYSDFANAKKEATDKNLKFWEDAGVEGMWDTTTVTNLRTGETHVTRKLNSAVWIYNMKCRHRDNWHDSKDVNLKGDNVKTRLVIHMGKDDDE